MAVEVLIAERRSPDAERLLGVMLALGHRAALVGDAASAVARLRAGGIRLVLLGPELDDGPSDRILPQLAREAEVVAAAVVRVVEHGSADDGGGEVVVRRGFGPRLVARLEYLARCYCGGHHGHTEAPGS